MLIKEKE